MPRRFAAALLALPLVLGLAACDGPGSSDPGRSTQSQSVQAACAAVDDAVADAVSALAAVDPADPAAAGDAIAAVAAQLKTASADVANSTVAALLPPMQDDLAAIGAALKAIAEGDLSQSAELAAPIAGMQESFAHFREACGRS